MNDLEVKRQKYNTAFKVGLIGLAALIISPIIFMVVQGLVGAAIAAGIGLVVVNAAPVVSMKLANWKVKGIVAEAAKNPIETMTNLLIEKRKAYQQFKESVTNAVTARNSFAEKCTKFAKQYPARAPEFQKQLDNMTALVEQKKRALNDAEEALKQGALKLEEMKAYWDMSQAAIEANKAAGMDTGDFYEKLKVDTACDAVFDSMSKAFAQLEVEAALQIDNDPSPTLNTTTINVDAKVKV